MKISRLILLVIVIYISGMYGLALAQGGQNPPGRTQPPKVVEAEALTPPLVVEFREDYVSIDPNRIMKWITPRRGLIEDGILLTYEETRQKMQQMQSEMKGIKLKMDFNRGLYTSASNENNFYRAFFEVNIGEGKVNQNLKIIAVFERINEQWFLIQTQNLRLAQSSPLPTMDKPLLEPNALMVGDHVPEFIGLTLAKKPQKVSSVLAQRKGRPMLLNFFTRISGDFGGQLDWAQSLYPKFLNKNIYIFCVTDDELEFLKPYLADGKWKLAVLRDDKSLVHLDLKIDIHPYIMLVDHQGMIRTISRGYNKNSLGLVEKMMTEIIDEANRAKVAEKKGGAPIHKQ